VRVGLLAEEGSRLQSYLRPVCGAAEVLRAMGRTAHGEPINAIGFFEPRVLSAWPRVGRTEILIVDRLARWVAGSFLSLADGLGSIGLIDGVLGPDSPGDSSQFVGQSDSGTFVAAAFLKGQSPAA
jgi:hypothetical protein